MCLSMLKKVVACLKPGSYDHLEEPGSIASSQEALIPDYNDGLIWSVALAKHLTGDVSYAVVNSNFPIEDQSQVESGQFGTFVGIYDGHGGAQASTYMADHYFPTWQACAEGAASVEDAFQGALQETESKFLEVVRANWKSRPQYAAVGTCAVMGLLEGGVIHVACLGDSRAVLGSKKGPLGQVKAEEMSTEHNASKAAEREEVIRQHPGEKDIVVERQGVWRVKGIIQVTRAMGDFYLKLNEFQHEPLVQRFRLPQPLKRPALSITPSMRSHHLTPDDRFIIFASDGLWEHVPNQEACEIVMRSPRVGVARRLIKVALFRAAKQQGISLKELPRVDRAQRRQVHDDISVVVLFFDFERAKPFAAHHKAKGVAATWDASLSIRGMQEFKATELRHQLRHDVVSDKSLR